MSFDCTGVDVGKLPQALHRVVLVAILTLGVTTPAHATSSVVIDYCTSIKTGKIHGIIEGSCPSGERSLGLGKLLPSAKRPQNLNAQLVARFNAARTVGASHGYTLRIRSGWRSVNHQQNLFNSAIKKYGSATAAAKWVLPPSQSLHTWGLAIDVRYSGDVQGAAHWFQEYSAHFGLCRRYKNEWWHYEPLVSPGQKCPALEASASSSSRS